MQLHDLRAMQQSATITDAHSMPIRDIDFARQQDNLLATAGIDCMFRLWDLRCCSVWLFRASQVQGYLYAISWNKHDHHGIRLALRLQVMLHTLARWLAREGLLSFAEELRSPASAWQMPE